MRKTSSQGSIFKRPLRPSSKIIYVKEGISLRAQSGTSRKKFPKINNNNNPILFSSNSTSDVSTYGINLTQPQKYQKDLLYEEVIQLKKQINNLRNKISLLKSDNQKKNDELLIKEKEIDTFIEDSKNNDNDNNAIINVEKLKDTNSISKLKKDYFTLKKTLEEKTNFNKELKIQIRNVKPLYYKHKNDYLQNQLTNLVKEYYQIQENNTNNEKLLKELSNLPLIFKNNHNQIEDLQKNITDKKKQINLLKNKLFGLNNIHSKNNDLIKKQKINQFTLIKRNDMMLENKKNKEIVIQMKNTYKKKIEELNDKIKEYQDKISNSEKMIKELMNSNVELKKINEPEKTFLKEFNYKKLISIEKPNNLKNQKILLLKSLVNESYNKRKNYVRLIEEYIAKLKDYGVDISLIGGENSNISEKNVNEQNDNNMKENIKEEENKKENNEEKKEKKTEPLFSPFTSYTQSIFDIKTINNNSTNLIGNINNNTISSIFGNINNNNSTSIFGNSKSLFGYLNNSNSTSIFVNSHLFNSKDKTNKKEENKESLFNNVFKEGDSFKFTGKLFSNTEKPQLTFSDFKSKNSFFNERNNKKEENEKEKKLKEFREQKIKEDKEKREKELNQQTEVLSELIKDRKKMKEQIDMKELGIDSLLLKSRNEIRKQLDEKEKEKK